MSKLTACFSLFDFPFHRSKVIGKLHVAGQVDFCETSLEIAARATRMAVHICKKIVPMGYLKRSLMATARFMSTSCTGVYTAEVAMALVQKQLGFQSHTHTVYTAPSIYKGMLFTSCTGLGIINKFDNKLRTWNATNAPEDFNVKIEPVSCHDP